METDTALPDPIASKLSTVLDLLEERYGRRRWRSHGDPLDELISTILSQHTSDTNTARAFASLKGRFPRWSDALDATVIDIADAIRSGGLANQKAPRIQAILTAIEVERGSLDIDHLRRLPLEPARNWLTGLHGVGPKTAACVLLFSLGKPALPVDTHVHRVAKRLGLIGQTVGADAAHRLLEPGLGGDRERVYSFHLTMIAHGRAVCTARRPYCERCPLTECCDYYAEPRHHDPESPSSPATPH